MQNDGGEISRVASHTGELQYETSDEGHSTFTFGRAFDLTPDPWPCPKPDSLPSITNAPPSYHIAYTLTNRVGPRYYRNLHLRPQDHAALRALHNPEAFSTQFPPIPALPPGSPPLRTVTLSRPSLGNWEQSSSLSKYSEDDPTSPGPGSSSGSVVGSGTSTTTKFASASLAALVDSMDVSNPYGTKFRHDSPYDLGNRKGKTPDRGSSPWKASSSPSPSTTDVCLFIN